MKLIEPRNLKGFRDYLPPEQIARAKMLETIKKVFELFGFEPLETPVLEYEDVLTGKYGAEGEQLGALGAQRVLALIALGPLGGQL